MDTNSFQSKHVVLGNTISEIKAKIMYRLIEDEDLCKLLYYDTPDALDQDITSKQIMDLFLPKENNTKRRIYLKPYPNQVTSVKNCEIRIHMIRMKVETTPYVYQPYIQIDIFCHNDLTDLNDGISQRQDVLMQKVNDLLANYHLDIIGNMNLVQIDDWSMQNSAYLGYSLLFTVGTINM